MNKHDATEIAYKNGFVAGGIAAAKRILGGIKGKLQKVSFSDIKERFLIFDLIKSYEEDFKRDEGGMHIRVPYVLEIGQKVYSVLPRLFEYETDLISEETVTDIGARGFWISACAPANDDHGFFFGWDRVGVDIFFTREEAEREAKERNKI